MWSEVKLYSRGLAEQYLTAAPITVEGYKTIPWKVSAEGEISCVLPKTLAIAQPAGLSLEYREYFSVTRDSLVWVNADSIGGAVQLARTFKKRGLSLFVMIEGNPATLPCKIVPSKILTPNLPPYTTAAAQIFEDFGLPSRIIGEGAGCFEGDIASLAVAENNTLNRQVIDLRL